MKSVSAGGDELGRLDEVGQLTDMAERRYVRIGGVDIIAATRGELVSLMVEEWRRNVGSGYSAAPKLSFSANGHVVALYGKDPVYRRAVQQAYFVDADGMPLVLFSRLSSGPSLPERVATTDFFHDLARAAQSHGMSFYLLGGREDVNSGAHDVLQSLYPGLRIVGRHHGYFDAREEPSIVQQVRDRRPDVLWVGLGSPYQERFCVRNRMNLSGVTWIKTCGGLFDFLSGQASRAPSWMQNAGLEWAYRSLREPRRLGWRYLTTNPYAVWRMLRCGHESAGDNGDAG